MKNQDRFIFRKLKGIAGGLLSFILGVMAIMLWNADLVAAQQSVNPKTVDVSVNGDDVGRQFYGVGAKSQGGSTRLLIDYPKEERDEILDYLFKPGYGASLDILKVGMGGGANATDGSEPSHMRSPDEINCNRGWNWWLMKEAKKRNPDITLMAQEWSAPGWLEGVWSEDNIDYHLSWLKCAEQHGLQIDWIGGWNESGYDSEYFIKLHKALEKHYPDVKVPAPDGFNWDIAADMAKNPDLMKAVDAVAVHFECDWRSFYKECYSSDTAKALGKPLWLSANSALGWDNGAGPHARALNRMYIDAKMANYMTWNVTEARYGNLPLGNTGLMGAIRPWSGHYQLGNNIWAFAHTAQVTDIGWHYLDTGSKRLENGATMVSLTSPDKKEYSMILEAMDLKDPDTVQVQLKNLPLKLLHTRISNFGTEDQSQQFVDGGTISPRGGVFEFIIKPNHVYSITTRETMGKGDAQPASDTHEKLSLPFFEGFESTELVKNARYFTPVNGSFEVQPCKGGREGKCYQQMITQQPINWNATGDMPPTSMVGDPRWWSDYTIKADVMLEKPGYVEVIGRVSGQLGWTPYLGGYHFQVGSDGWKLYNEDSPSKTITPIDSGKTSIQPGKWHTMAMSMRANHIVLKLDGKTLATIENSGQLQGNVAIRASKWQQAQFDDITVTPTGPEPEFVSYDSMSIAEYSSVQGFWGGWTFEAENVIDDRLGTQWQSKNNGENHSLTIDLGGVRNIEALWLRPRRPYFDKNNTKHITGYRVEVSRDGGTYETVDKGEWPATGSTKIAAWGEKVPARFVRLIVLDTNQGAASASEIQLISELPDEWSVFK